MAKFTRTRAEVQSMLDDWLEVNRQAEQTRDWQPLADYYADDAVYQYTIGAFGKRVARGKDEVRKQVMDRDMQGFDGWTFPYERIVVEGDQVMTKWYCQAPQVRPDGTPYRIVGMSSILLDNDLHIKEMEDSIDVAALFALLDEMRAAGIGVTVPSAPDLSTEPTAAQAKA